jgi:hypothetical protein
MYPMKRIQPSDNDHQFPRHATQSVETRDRVLVIRIADWTDDKNEPAYDVEVYIGGVYDWNESKTFTLREYKTKPAAKVEAINFFNEQTRKLL